MRPCRGEGCLVNWDFGPPASNSLWVGSTYCLRLHALKKGSLVCVDWGMLRRGMQAHLDGNRRLAVRGRCGRLGGASEEAYDKGHRESAVGSFRSSRPTAARLRATSTLSKSPPASRVLGGPHPDRRRADPLRSPHTPRPGRVSRTTESPGFPWRLSVLSGLVRRE